MEGKQSRQLEVEGFSSIQVLGFHKITIPQLPQFSHSHSMFLTNDNNILLCGRQQFIVEDSEWGPRYAKDFYHKMVSNQECLKLENGQWVHHSTLNQSLNNCFAITMPNGVYMFGGQLYGTAQTVRGEFLENGSTKWEMVPKLIEEKYPSFLNHHGQFSGLRISEEEFVLIGIGNQRNNVIKYNIKQKDWEIVMKMKIPRYAHNSVLVKNKIIIRGGALFDPSSTSINCPPMPKTEVIYLPSWTSKVIEHEKENCSSTYTHTSCGIMTFKNQERLVSFEKTSKVWNDDKEEWEVIEPELNINIVGFGILSLPSTMLMSS